MPASFQGPVMSVHPDSPIPIETQRWVRPGVAADAPVLDAWLMARAPLAVPEARGRRLALDALLEQGGHGICLMAGTDAVRALLPIVLVHSLSTGGRVAMATEWWPPESGDADDWLAECCIVLAEWCRAHGIRHAMLAPGLIADAARAPAGFVRGAEGLWRGNLVPTAKHLG
ncbi:hypothetical protein Cmtc_29720 [Cupriavidus sp. TKC]|nr:hypothetical protein D769_29824 [Cupriavidus sp. HMR-1]GMG91752.1 hypothetical protein Cmtc_29720 [Cupriavidus sp. TKC]HBD39335.1 hypothetical protein [Cupriavidus sp.]